MRSGSIVMPMRNRIRTILLGVACAVLIIGCGADGGSPSGSNTFRLNINSEPNSFDPIRISQQASWWIGSQVYEGLVSLDADLNTTGGLAESWETSEDGLIYTFTLREGARFPDNPAFEGGKGRAVKADDVRRSFERVALPGESSGYWVFRDKVVGINEFYAAREANPESPSVTSVEGFEVVDDRTFRIHLVEPYAPFLYLLTTPFCYVHPHEAIEHYGEDFARNPVGSGPFRLAAWDEGTGITLVRNEAYDRTDSEGTPLPYLDSVVVSFIGDPGTEFAEFEAGNLDLLTAVSPTFAERLLTEDGTELADRSTGYVLHSQPGMSIEYYGFTVSPEAPVAATSPFVDNVHLRRAMNYAIDRESITTFVLKGQAAPAEFGPIPPETPGYSGVKGYSYDPERARAELEEAGFPNGEGLGTVEIQVSNNPQTASVAERVQDDLKKVGFDVEIRQKEHRVHLDESDRGEVAVWRTSWLADYPHAENFMANFYSEFKKPSGPNRSRYENPTFDSLYRAALRPGLSDAEQTAIWAEAERVVLDDAPWLFLYYSVVRHITQPWVSGYDVSPLQTFDLSRVRITS